MSPASRDDRRRPRTSMVPGRTSTASVDAASQRRAPQRGSDGRPRRPRSAEARLLPIAIILWIVGLLSFVAAFTLGNTGSGAVMSVTFFGGLILATVAEVGAFLTALASSVSYRRHRPWNVIFMILSVVLSPATLILLLQLAIGV